MRKQLKKLVLLGAAVVALVAAFGVSTASAAGGPWMDVVGYP